MKTHSAISFHRAERTISAALNPLAQLTPESLIGYLDDFRRGRLANAARAWDLIERRDDVVTVVAQRRKKTVARCGWEIIATESSREADKQKAVLEDFYNQITATNAEEPDDIGGLSLLIRQMMDAVGKRYSVHEIVWQPSANGLTAKLIHCPLWWFESTRGALAYLKGDNDSLGTPLDPAGWMVTVADGLMEACSIAWLVKFWALRDWTLFSARNGKPWIKGVSSAKLHSASWERMQEAVDEFCSNMAVLVEKGSTIETISTQGTGQIPYEPFVDRMDRAIARIWLGSDLGTLSRRSAVGASLQGDAADSLKADDAAAITETLAKTLSRQVLEYHFGAGVKRLAYLKLRADPPVDTAKDLQIDNFFKALGIPTSERSLRERYGRPAPTPGETLVAENPTDKPVASLPATHITTAKVS